MSKFGNLIPLTGTNHHDRMLNEGGNSDAHVDVDANVDADDTDEDIMALLDAPTLPMKQKSSRNGTRNSNGSSGSSSGGKHRKSSGSTHSHNINGSSKGSGSSSSRSKQKTISWKYNVDTNNNANKTSSRGSGSGSHDTSTNKSSQSDKYSNNNNNNNWNVHDSSEEDEDHKKDSFPWTNLKKSTNVHATTRESSSSLSSPSTKEKQQGFGYNVDDILKMTNDDTTLPTTTTTTTTNKNLANSTYNNNLSKSGEGKNILQTKSSSFSPSSGSISQRPRRSGLQMQDYSNNDSANSNHLNNNNNNNNNISDKQQVSHASNSSEKGSNQISLSKFQNSTIQPPNMSMGNENVHQDQQPLRRRSFPSSLNYNDTNLQLQQQQQQQRQQQQQPEQHQDHSQLLVDLETLKVQTEERRLQINTLETQIKDYNQEKDERISQHATEMETYRMEQEFHQTNLQKLQDKVSKLEETTQELRTCLHQEELKRAELEHEHSKKLLHAAEEKTKFQTLQNERFMEWQRNQDDYVQQLTQSHADEMDRVHTLHTKELESIQKTISDTRTLDAAANQMKENANLLKMLESKWNTSKTEIETDRRNDLERREALLLQMEQSAQSSQQRSESEAAKLRSSIQKIDGVLNHIRSHNSEERTRLEGEHNRLVELQSSLLAEREQTLLHFNDEKARLGERWSALEEERRRVEASFSDQKGQLERERSDLKKLREEFEAYKAESIRKMECTSDDLKAKEERLVQTRQKLSEDIAIFNQKRESARAELESAEATRLEINSMRSKLDDEKNRLTRMGDELSSMNALITMKDKEADKKLALADKFRADGEKSRQMTLAERSAIEMEREKLCSEVKKAETERLNIVYEKSRLLHGKEFARQIRSNFNVVGNATNQTMMDCNSSSNLHHLPQKTFSRDALLSIQNQLNQLGSK